jgi:hypothetical protein
VAWCCRGVRARSHQGRGKGSGLGGYDMWTCAAAGGGARGPAPAVSGGGRRSEQSGSGGGQRKTKQAGVRRTSL